MYRYAYVILLAIVLAGCATTQSDVTITPPPPVRY